MRSRANILRILKIKKGAAAGTEISVVRLISMLRRFGIETPDLNISKVENFAKRNSLTWRQYKAKEQLGNLLYNLGILIIKP